MPLVRALILAGVACAAASGGYRDAEDVTPSSKIHRLAAFSLDSLKMVCAASNSIGCSHISGASLHHVRSAQTQVVSGVNYVIEVQTSAGTLHLKVYEQSWSSTLRLTEATLTPASVGMSFAIVQESLLDEELDMDAARFAATDHTCEGGKVWNECGSPCEKTCEEPAPMCMAMCQAKCVCPSDKPIWQDGQCIKASDCAAPGTLHAPCVPHLAPCPRNFAPVCAHGTTYDNMCLARAACATEEETTPGRCATATARPALLGGGATQPSTPLAGGFQPATEIGAGSKVHHLTDFSLRKLKGSCAASNSFACSHILDASLHHVESAHTQVVAGVNYVIDAVTSAGSLHLKIFEQSWSRTLVISEAKLTLPPQGASLAILTQSLVEDSLPLDVTEFDAFVEQAEAAAAATVVAQRAAAPQPTMPLLGGYKVVEEVAPGSKMHKLASYALASLIPAAVLHRVVRAQSQVVSGSNYVIEVHTSVGCLHLKVYEQTWSSTLELVEAKQITFEDGRVTGEQSLLDEALALDAIAFEEYSPVVADPASSAVTGLLLGGAPMTGDSFGGHYTGSDQELLGKARGSLSSSAPADADTPTVQLQEAVDQRPRDSATQWWLLGFFVFGVLIVAILTVIMRGRTKADETPLNNAPSSSSADEMADLPNMSKCDSSIA